MHYTALMRHSLSPTIAHCRKHVGVTAAELAARLGITQSSVTRLEQSEARGAISIASLRKAAEVLGYELRYALHPISESSTSSGTKRRGALGLAMSTEQVAAGASLSPEARVLRSFQLSDLIRQLMHSSATTDSANTRAANTGAAKGGKVGDDI